MSNDGRGAVEGTQYQGPGETITWAVVVAGTAVSVAPALVMDEGIDVTTAVMPTGSTIIQDDAIQFPPLKNLTLNHGYRISTHYSDGLNTLEVYFNVVCT
jgi:hypothetical protein